MRRLVLLTLAALVVLSGCTPAAPGPQRPEETSPKRGGTLRVAILGDATPNPFTWPGQLPTILVMKTMFNTLTKFNPKDNSLVPDLATGWSISPDGTGWTFKLRSGVRWHDGRPFTAEDVKFTIESIINPKVNALFRSNLAGVTGADILDSLTVRINSRDPIASLPILLGYNIAIAPKHLLEGKDLNEIPEFVANPVGTGPFKFKENVRGDHFTVVVNEDYFEGRPYLDSIVFKVIPDLNVVTAQLRTGELDLAMVEPVNRQALQGAAHLNFIIAEEPNVFFIALNNTRPLFQDKRVRQALMYGLDRKLIVDTILEGLPPLATGPLPKAMGEFYDPDLKPYPYDPGKAKALLAEAGWRPGPDGILQKDGQRFSFELMVDKGNPTREQIAVTAQQYWKRLGIDVRLDVQEWAVYLSRGNKLPGDYDARTGWRITAPDPDKTAEYATGGANNHFGYSNPEVDRLLAEGRRTFDHQKRTEIYRQFQRVVYEDVPIIWIYYPVQILAVNKRVKDLPEGDLRNVLTYMHRVWVQ